MCTPTPYGDCVCIVAEFPIGQEVMEIANLNEIILEKIDQQIQRFLSVV